MTDSIRQDKQALRAELRGRRELLTQTEREESTEQFTEHLKTLVQSAGASTIACYLSGMTEPNTRGFLNWAIETGVRVLLPITREDGLLDWTIADGHSETIGLMGVPEPVGEILSPLALNEVDLIVVPASAVARNGVRLGWGRGYYDRSLGSMENSPPVYAMVYEHELVDQLPEELHDHRVTGAITPSGVLTFSSAD